MMKSFALVLLGATLLSIADGSRILGLFPFTARSHFNIMEPIMKELAKRGHEVVVMSNFPQKSKVANYTDITIDPFDHWKLFGDGKTKSSPYEMTGFTQRDLLSTIWKMGHASCDSALNTKAVKELIHAGPEVHFDLIFVEAFFQEPFLMFAHKFKCPIVAACSGNVQHSMSEAMGNIAPWSHVPYEYSEHDHHMTLVQRMENVFSILQDKIGRWLFYWPRMESLAKEHFSHLGPLPSLRELSSNISVLLANSHVSLNGARPFIPGIVEVGGLHIREPKPLPQDIQRLIDDAKNGVIYFSMGSNLKGSDLPPKARAALLGALGRLPQLVLWKWEGKQGELGDDVPKNVVVRAWWPQSDILAHPNVRVFITHSGLLSTQEALHRGVPILGLPVYADQKINAGFAVRAGYAKMIPFAEVKTEEQVYNALKQLVGDPKYRENAQKLSGLFRDRVRNPLETAIYWVEYVIRHKGAPHLRPASLGLCCCSYYLLDLLGIFLAVCAVPLLILKKLCCALKRKMSGSEDKTSNKKKKN